jgi:hypothetical protein
LILRVSNANTDFSSYTVNWQDHNGELEDVSRIRVPEKRAKIKIKTFGEKERDSTKKEGFTTSSTMNTKFHHPLPSPTGHNGGKKKHSPYLALPFFLLLSASTRGTYGCNEKEESFNKLHEFSSDGNTIPLTAGGDPPVVYHTGLPERASIRVSHRSQNQRE